MKGRAVWLDTLPDGRRLAALTVDGQIEDILADPPDAWGPAQPGAIFRARMGRPMKGMGGAMVDLGDGLTGFLRETKGLSPGAAVLVQVGAVSESAKAPPVSRRLLFKGRNAILTPGSPGINVSRAVRDEGARARLQSAGQAAMAGADPDFGLILRSAAGAAENADIEGEIAELRALAEAMLADATGAPELLLDAPDAHLAAWRDWADPAPELVDDAPGAFERGGIWDALRAVLSPEIPLGGGAWMTVEPTRALVAIDVNTGADTSPAAGLKANVAALRALPRALRLRGLAGQITVDPAPFSKRERPQLEQVLNRAMREDAGEMLLAGWTPLGHMEMQRKRDRHPLAKVLKDALPDL
ncbi:ribonuclease G [Halovulum dunhuangense]|uniref:Ribonuclease G n=1 Tax=Halovulum dunhuangense TaxID=1505036 RepID=A0A849L403_9RHOB|nr:ribonuclease E/G [Halovulum dunhuangense]NNU81065.1 ribonuclease G [Halovulum dunhuangense]